MLGYDVGLTRFYRNGRDAVGRGRVGRDRSPYLNRFSASTRLPWSRFIACSICCEFRDSNENRDEDIGQDRNTFGALPIYDTALYKPENGLIEMNRISSDVLSGSNSHLNTGTDVSI